MRILWPESVKTSEIYGKIAAHYGGNCIRLWTFTNGWKASEQGELCDAGSVLKSGGRFSNEWKGSEEGGRVLTMRVMGPCSVFAHVVKNFMAFKELGCALMY
jgi:hypothetical protein